MTPRKPPEHPDDEMQDEILQAVHDALNDFAALSDPAAEQPLAGTQHAEDVAVEIDRIEAYLRGPTAFTA